MSKKILLIFVLMISTFLWQCSDQSVNPPQVQRRELTAAEKQLVSSGNKFGLELFKEVVKEQGDKNVFMSPLSVSMALGMTYNGADGSTRDAMQKTLALDGMTLEEVNQSYRSLIDLFAQLDPKVKFQIANSIWYADNFSVEQPFIDLNRTYFDAVVQALNFKDPAAVVTINNWVNEKTNGKIDKIIQQIPESAVMYLINAIYFKGTWTTQFEKKNTHEGIFYSRPDSLSTCLLMYQSKSKFLYHRFDGFEIGELSYSAGDYAMTIILPNRSEPIAAVEQQLNEMSLSDWLSQLQPDEEDFYLPKFKLDFSIKLNDVLTAMGMGIAFSDMADFSNINRDGGLSISEVLHKTYVAVEEEGTEAAAATSVGMQESFPPPGFYVDHPFLFAIRETKSGTILFIGKIVSPEWNEN